MLLVNSVYRLYDRKYRILKELVGNFVIIDIGDEKSFPELRNAKELIRLIENFDCELIEDPYIDLISEKPERGSKKEMIRDKNYELIKPIISHEKYYIPTIRSQIIKEIINEKETTKQTLYRLIRSYWKRGQVPNALLPLYKNSGAKGKKRIAKEKKLGRPRIYTEGVGALVNENTHRLFSITINKFLLNDKNFTEKYAYLQFKKLYKSQNPDVEETDVPSIWQFKHFYHSEFTQNDKVKLKTDKIIYN